MRILPLLSLALSLAACGSTPAGADAAADTTTQDGLGNDALDSGATPGTFTGPLGFVASSAFEIVIDAGQPGDTGLTMFSVFAYENPASCPNVVSGGRSLEIDGTCSSGSAFAPGSYDVTMLQNGCILGVKSSVALPDGGSELRTSHAGTVTLTALSDQRVQGSISVTMAAPDGGDPTPLSGSFAAVRCP